MKSILVGIKRVLDFTMRIRVKPDAVVEPLGTARIWKDDRTAAWSSRI